MGPVPCQQDLHDTALAPTIRTHRDTDSDAYTVSYEDPNGESHSRTFSLSDAATHAKVANPSPVTLTP